MMSSSRTPFLEAQLEPNPLEDLRRWVNAQVQQGVARFLLFSRREKQPIEEWAVSELLDLGNLASLIFAVAQREASALQENVPYMVFALRPEASSAASRYTFRINAGGEAWAADQDTPDERGKTGMLMRHADMAARLALGASRGLMDQYDKLLELGTAHLARLLEQAHRRIEVLEEREARALDLREQLATQAHTHTERMQELTNTAEGQKHLIDSLAPLAPMLLTAVANRQGAGIPIARTSANGDANAPAVAGSSRAVDLHPDLQLFDQLVQSVLPHQMMRLSGILEPDQAGVFQTLMAHSMERLRDAKAAEEAPKAAVASPVPAPAPTSPAAAVSPPTVQAAPGPTPTPAPAETSVEVARAVSPPGDAPRASAPRRRLAAKSSRKPPPKRTRGKS